MRVDEKSDQEEEQARQAANKRGNQDREEKDRGAFGRGSPAP